MGENESEFNGIQRQPDSELPATDTGTSGQPDSMAKQVVERETDMPSIKEVAERVYRLLLQDIRRERERQGRW